MATSSRIRPARLRDLVSTDWTGAGVNIACYSSDEICGVTAVSLTELRRSLTGQDSTRSQYRPSSFCQTRRTPCSEAATRTITTKRLELVLKVEVGPWTIRDGRFHVGRAVDEEAK